MSGNIINTNIRLNLDREADRRAWEYLQSMDRTRFRSYSRAVVAAVNDFFDRQEIKQADPYLETREKEDAFLQKVLDTVERGMSLSASRADVSQSVPLNEEQSYRRRSENSSVNTAGMDTEQNEVENTLLDFIDSL